MRDPQRLLQHGATEREHLLLSAGACDEPPADGAQRLALALGLSTSLIAASSAAAQTGVKLAAQGAVPSTGTKLLLKWAVAGLGGAAVVTGILLTSTPGPTATPKPASPASTPQISSIAAAPAAPTEQPAQATSEAKPEHPVPLARTAMPSSKSIAREVAQLDTARVALSQKHLRQALATLDHYAREHPHGVLTQEATLLRIEVLLSAHDETSARRIAHTFLREHPHSPHAARVEALLMSHGD